MGNYLNELGWKIIRANNLLQFIQQVTIEILESYFGVKYLSNDMKGINDVWNMCIIKCITNG